MTHQVDGMRYETRLQPRIKRKWAAKRTNDITKLSTMMILWKLYKRHETDILTAVVATQFALLIVWK